MKHSGETYTNATLSVEEARDIFSRENDRIMDMIEAKIDRYHPLKYEEAVVGFLAWIQQDDFLALRALPEAPLQGEINVHLDELARNYLIEQAYYKLEEKFVKWRLKKELSDYEPNNIKFMEIVDFVIERIERDNFARIKSYKEKSRFKSYLGVAVTSILKDYWRSVFSAQKNVKKFSKTKITVEEVGDDGHDGPLKQEIHIDELFGKEEPDPYNLAADNELGEVLPAVLDKIDKKLKLVFHLKYDQGMNSSLIARTLGKSRYKAERLVEKMEFFIKKKLMIELKKRRRQQ